MNIHQFNFDGRLLQRGFWIYVWRVTNEDGRVVYYVGRTGDSSSSNAASPFNRMSAHLGRNEKNNALRKNLSEAGLEPELCTFELSALGPVYDEVKDFQEHRVLRDKMATLELLVASSLKERGVEVLGSHGGNPNPSEELRRIAEELLSSVAEV